MHPPIAPLPAPVPPLPSPLPPPPAAAHRPQGNDKIWSILSHLSGFLSVPFLLPLVVYLAMREDSRYVGENAREALNFHISVFIYLLASVPLIFVFGLGGVLAGAIALASAVLAIIAAIKASEGECYHYPLTLRLVR